jgi:C4-dicarboxylate-specific signal transduction histidine kinase
MLAEAQRAGDIVRRLRDFFRAGTTRLEVVSIDDLLAAVRRIADSAVAGSGISLQIDRRETIRPLFVDRLQVEVILRNLITNAAESLTASSRAAGQIRILVEPHGDRSVRVVVADNGPGVSTASRAGLFEPFVSGKPTGMGLGLAVSRTIAQAHGGSLEATGAAHGEFQLVLPCVQND